MKSPWAKIPTQDKYVSHKYYLYIASTQFESQTETKLSHAYVHVLCGNSL